MGSKPRCTSSQERPLIEAAWQQEAKDSTSGERDTGGSASSPLPEAIGPYRILRKIGAGGMGVVYEAAEAEAGLRVALKVLRGKVSDEHARRLFQREARALGCLEHEGIVGIRQSGHTEDGEPFIAMDFVAGLPLDEYLRQRKPGVTGGLDLLRRVCEAVAHAHLHGVIHRDLKPSNILVDHDGRPRVLDFGLARFMDGAEGSISLQTEPGRIQGTLPYMSPEQLRGDPGQIDLRTDVYTLGVIIYETLLGRRPFDETSREALREAISQRPAPDPRRLRRGLPTGLSVVLATALAKDPADRYQSVMDLGEDLDRVVKGLPVRARPLSPWTRCARWVRREPWKALSGAVGVTALILVGYLALKWSDLQRLEATERQREVELLLGRAHLDLGHGRPAEALPAFQRALERDPHSLEARAGAAIALLRSRTPEAALATIESSDDPRLIEIRIAVLRELGRGEEVRELQERRSDPDDALGWYLRGMHALDHGHQGDPAAFDRALRCMQRAVHLAPAPRPLYLQGLIDAASHRRDRRTCEAAAAALIAHWPQDPNSWTWAGLALKDFEPEAALDHLDQALVLDAETALAHYFRGDALQSLRRFPEAIEAYRTALARDRHLAAAWDRLGVACMRSGHFEEAAEAFDRAIAMAPGGAMLHFNRALAARRLERFDDAERHARKAIDLNPRQDRPWGSLIMTLADLGRSEEAIETAHEALAKVAQKASIHNELGIVLESQDDIPAACAAYERSLEIDPHYRAAWSNLGRVKARHDPDDLDFVTTLARVQNRWADLATVWRHAFEHHPEFAEDLDAGYRSRAAGFAARAASDPRFNAEGRASWRGLALSWLRADLVARRARVEAGERRAARLIRVLERWQQREDLRHLRDPERRAHLPENEGRSWAAFWEEVDQLISELE